MNTKKTRLLSIVLLMLPLAAWSDNITFADANVKAICVQNWDTNGDGELSEAEAAAVTELGRVFMDNNTITSFNELQYFTRLTSIGNGAFGGCSGLTSLTIPNSVTTIGNNAFGRSGLISVTIPNSVTSIGNSAFQSCSALTSVIIPESVTSIGNSAFYYCTSLTSVTIPNSVTSIGERTFRGCSALTSVIIPESVTSIGQEAFYLCSSLTFVTVEMETPLTIAENTFSKRANATLYVPAGCKAAYETAQYWQDFTIKDASSPAITFADANVKAICVQNWDANGDGELSLDEAAAVNDLGTVFQSNTSITSFDELQYFTGLTTIETTAFWGCSSLTSVTIPNSVTSIGDHAFGLCSGLTSLTIPNSVNTIGDGAFIRSGLISVTIPNSVTTIGDYAFKGCSALTSVIIPESVTSIGLEAFYQCSCLTSITIPNSVRSIGTAAFSGCTNLISVSIGNSVRSIGSGAFYHCTGLTSVTIPNSVTSIGNQAFEGCSSLTSITIPNSVTSIGQTAFYQSSSLTSVHITDLEAWCKIVFGVSAMPSYHLYLNGEEIKDLVIPNSVSTIGGYAFSNCTSLTSVTIPNSVTSIGSSAFSYCNGLTSVTIPNSVTSIGSSAFEGCEDLTSVTIPSGVTSIGNSAFSRCTGLKTLIIPNSVASIDQYAFYGCANLISVTVEMETPPTIKSSTFSNRANATLYVPAGCKAAYEAANYWKEFKQIVEPSPAITFADANVKAICVQNWDTNGDGELSEAEAAAVTDLGTVFRQNKNITSFDELQYFTGLTSIADSAFYNCTGMTSMAIPNTVTTIGKRAFMSCSGLTSVTIPESVTNIGYASFHNCDNLTSLTIPNSVTSVGVAAFATCNKLTSIIVENGNNSFISEDGVLFNKNKTSLICFPAGKTQSTYIIPESVTKISSYAFDSCNKLTSVDIPNSVTSIGEWVFSACSGLTSVTIPNSVTSIGNHAFWRCTSLASVTIPNSVTTIGGGAFGYCSTLTSVKVGMESPLTIDSETFTNRANTTLYIPKGCKSAYQAANYWKEFKAIKEFPDSDVNQDGEIDMMDVVDIARFVVGTPAETFVEFLADLNNNGEVNVADAVVLVNEIVGDQNFAKAFGAPQTAPVGDDRLTLTKNDEHSLSFSMESQRDYTAFQFDLYTNSEDDVMGLRLNTARKHGHQLIYNNVDEGHYRVVALSVANNTFNGNNGELLNIQLDGFNATDMTISNIHFITTDGTDYRFDDLTMSGATGIEGLTPNPSPKEEGNVYDLSGRKVSEPSVLPKGVYIMNGKKVIVK